MGRGHPMLQPVGSSSLNLLNWVAHVHPPAPPRPRGGLRLCLVLASRELEV